MNTSRLYATILTLCSLISLWLYFQFVPVIQQTPEHPNGVVYELSKGTSSITFSENLARQGIIQHAFLFSLYGYLQLNPHLKTGEYSFPAGSTTASIWYQVTHGTGFAFHAFKIIPGWTFSQVRKSLEQTTWVRQSLSQLDDKQLMSKLGYPGVEPEGEFFPDTYYYTKGVSDQVVLKRALMAMMKKFNEAWQQRDNGLPYKNPYEALIAASLVEKEAYLDEERPVIAGVLVNRLRKNMLLQFDPTVIYGMGASYTGKITKTDLRTDTAYNTYVRKGLPPTPIAIPSMASIAAVLHPENHDYLYFVARGDGSHQFSKTLSDHNDAVGQALKRKKIYFNETLLMRYMSPLMLSSKVTLALE